MKIENGLKWIEKCNRQTDSLLAISRVAFATNNKLMLYEINVQL